MRLTQVQVFIRGGNYIASDMLLRTNKQRYCDEVRMHAEVLQPCHETDPCQESHTFYCLRIRRTSCFWKTHVSQGAAAPSVMSPPTCCRS